MQLKRIAGDGNCLFRSLSHPVGSHLMVRACVVRYISKNWNEFRDFVVTDERGDYIQQMIRPGTWGDELVLRAFSDLSRRHVRVYTPSQRLISEYGSADDQPSVNVCFSGCHYDVFVP